MSASNLSPWSSGKEPRQSSEVVGCHGEDEAGPHTLDAAIDGLGHAAGSDNVTAPRRHQCATVGLQGSTKESGHIMCG